MLQGLLPLERPARRLRHGDDRDQFALGPHHRDRLPEDPSRRPPGRLGAAVSARDPDPARLDRDPRDRATRTWRTRPGFATPPPSSRRSWRAAISPATTSRASTCPSSAPSSCAPASRSRFRTGGSSTRSASSSRGSRATCAAAARFYCETEHNGAHGALADAEMTLRVFAGQLARYAELPRSVAGAPRALLRRHRPGPGPRGPLPPRQRRADRQLRQEPRPACCRTSAAKSPGS